MNRVECLLQKQTNEKMKKTSKSFPKLKENILRKPSSSEREILEKVHNLEMKKKKKQ